MNREDCQEIVDVLNEATKADPNAMNALVQLCVPVNKELANHPTIQCRSKSLETEQVVMRFVGLLNGFVVKNGFVITSDWDPETKSLIGFSLRDKEEFFGDSEGAE